MAQLPDKELISAYLDGELSAAEREEFERQLAASPEAQRELAELRTLSGLLQGLPQQSAPPEFRSRVMQAAERGMLLAEAAPAAIPFATEVADRGQAKKANWWPAASAILAAAAALLLMVQFLGQPRVGNQVAEAPPREGEDDALSRDDVELADRGAGGGAFGGTRATEAPAPADQDSFARNEEPASNAPRLVFNTNLNEARVGEVLDALDTSGDKVVVCKVTVVDMRVGLERLEVLLLQHHVQRDPAVGAAEKAKIAAPGAGKLVAMYVEATRKQLSPALVALNDEAAFQDQELQVDGSVDASALDADVEELARFRGLKETAPTAQEDERDAPAQPSPALADRSAKDSQLAAKSGAALALSRQKPINVSADVIKPTAEDREVAEAPADEAAPAQPKSENLGAARSDETPLQVLFVLVPASNSPGRPAESAPVRSKS
jgi:hypothetical protein